MIVLIKRPIWGFERPLSITLPKISTIVFTSSFQSKYKSAQNPTFALFFLSKPTTIKQPHQPKQNTILKSPDPSDLNLHLTTPNDRQNERLRSRMVCLLPTVPMERCLGSESRCPPSLLPRLLPPSDRPAWPWPRTVLISCDVKVELRG